MQQAAGCRRGSGRLPGLAAMVGRVPVQTEPLDAFAGVGLVAAQVVKYTEKPWFVHAGAELREVKVVAWKPEPANGAEHTVLYKGPFRQVTDDAGTVYPRAQRVRIAVEDAERLQRSGACEQFLFL